MRWNWIASILLGLWSISLQAQPYFPVKINKKWGLIDASGQVVLKPGYDAIGDFKDFGYAVMQRQGKIGLLDREGKEIIAPRYEDLKVLDSTLIAVMDFGEWMVINLHGQVVLNKGYTRVQVWDGEYLAFLQNKKWGIVNKYGRLIAEPRFDEVYREDAFFVTRRGDMLGLLSPTGVEILTNAAAEIKILSDTLFFYRVGRLWGAVDHYGGPLIPPKYDSYKKISDQFIKLVADNTFYLYSINCGSIVTHGEYDDYYPFSKKYIITKRKRQLGLIDWCGQELLSCQYNEIQPYDGNWFRVNFKGRWGVVTTDGQSIIPFEYDYIAPLRDKVCVVKKDGLYGVANILGKEVVESKFNRIVLENNQAKAYTYKPDKPGEEILTLISFDDQGLVKDNSSSDKHFQITIGSKKNTAESGVSDNNFVLEKFEWFYSPAMDRWGLRKLEDGAIQIEPKFHFIQVEPKLGFTLVGIEKSGKYEFERSTFRFDMIYGLVNNEVGALVTEVDFWDIRFDDYYNNYPVARCIFSNGRHGLIDRIGRIVKRDYAYIGEFQDGLARISLQGKLSGSLKEKGSLGKLSNYLANHLCAGYLVDYTQYDQLFSSDASLVCDGCQWGYIDTSASVVIQPQYTYAADFTNNVGIVACNEKWGMINRSGHTLIPCQYDGIGFLENTNNSIVKVYVQAPKYGLIDTLGQLRVGAVYDEIGSFAEGRLAVKRNGMWGFVNVDGLEVIPCRFREVLNFSEGLAAVKLGRQWGFIDKQGDVQIKFEYKRAGNFNNGLAWVQNDEGVGYVDRLGAMAIPARYEKAFDFQGGVARIVSGGKYGLIDMRGKAIARPRFTDIREFDSSGLAVVRFGDKQVTYGVINRQGQLITSQGYVVVEPFQDGMALVKDSKGFGFIDTTGKLVIPCIYSKAAPFYEGRAAVYKDGACGYIDVKGAVIIPFDFSRCLDFDADKAVVYKGIKRAGLVSLDGELILEPGLDRLLKFQEGRGLMRDEKLRFYYITEQANVYDGYYEKATAFKHGVAVVQINGKWGIINQKGIEIIPPKYDRIDSFEGGYAKVRIEGLNGLSNLDGQLIAQPDYEFISYAGQGLFRVEQGDKIGYFDTEGHWIWGLTQ
ncbi:MAG: WG repeat-containing protein [Saprospiraceae bacterium]|nr:WG repeat-containing protein [Saprospiraceae bacterium]